MHVCEICMRQFSSKVGLSNHTTKAHVEIRTIDITTWDDENIDMTMCQLRNRLTRTEYELVVALMRYNHGDLQSLATEASKGGIRHAAGRWFNGEEMLTQWA